MAEGIRIIHNADDEEPNCMKCDHCFDGTPRFCEECGKYYWCHYQRTEYLKVGKKGQQK